MTKVVRLIRHAQSAANAGYATAAPDSIPLTELGHQQARSFAETIDCAPGLIIASSFERSIHTATQTAKRYPSAPFEIWPVEEFTYLSPSRLDGTTQADRKPMVDAYWNEGDQAAIDGPGAESFSKLLERAKETLDRLAAIQADDVLLFSHGQFIRAIAWFIQHGVTAGTPDLMRMFRKQDVLDPLSNCAGYELVLLKGVWDVQYQMGPDGKVKFIDAFCSDQKMAPLPATLKTRKIRDALKRS